MSDAIGVNIDTRDYRRHARLSKKQLARMPGTDEWFDKRFGELIGRLIGRGILAKGPNHGKKSMTVCSTPATECDGSVHGRLGIIPLYPAEFTWIAKRIEHLAIILRNAGMISTEAASEISGIAMQDFIEKYGMMLSR